MPQLDLSQASYHQLRRLFYASRNRGDRASQDAILRELKARGAPLPHPRRLAAEAANEANLEGQLGAGADRPPAEGPGRFQPPGDSAANPGRQQQDQARRFGRGAEARPDEGGLKRSADSPRGATASARPRRPRRRAKLALVGSAVLLAGAVGVWMDYQGLGGPGRSRSLAAGGGLAPASVDTARAPVKGLPDALDAEVPARETPKGAQMAKAGEAASPAAPAATARRGLVIVQAPPPSAASSSAVRSPSSPGHAPFPQGRPLAVQEPAAEAPQPGGPVRVFVHIANAAQMPVADRVRSQLSELRLGGQAVGLPPVRFVRGAPRTTQVRCLKHADCASARRIAAYLRPALGPVAVVDMSSRYESDPTLRRGSLELWIPPGTAKSG